MTNQEFLDGFYLQSDTVASLASKSFEPNEITNMANRSMESLIIRKVRKESNKNNEGFEETEKRTQEIGELVKYKTFPSSSLVIEPFFPNSQTVILPNTFLDTVNADTQSPAGPGNYDDIFWLTIYENAILNKLDCTIPNNTTVYEEATVIEANHNQVGYMLRDPFNKPKYVPGNSKVLRLRTGNRRHILISAPGVSLTEYQLGYIRKPKPVNLNGPSTNQVCELSDIFHRELLEETVITALKESQNPGQLQLELAIPKE